jgi:hypothetical protein
VNPLHHEALAARVNARDSRCIGSSARMLSRTPAFYSPGVGARGLTGRLAVRLTTNAVRLAPWRGAQHHSKIRHAKRCRSEAPPNFTLKLVRPGFGPAAELPTLFASAAASRRLQLASRCFSLIAATGAPLCFGTWALAAQLSVRSVRWILQKLGPESAKFVLGSA